MEKAARNAGVKLFISTFICDQFAFEEKKDRSGLRFTECRSYITISCNGIVIVVTSDGLLVQNKSSTLPSRVGSRCIWETWSRNSCKNFSHAVFMRDDGRNDFFSHSKSPTLSSLLSKHAPIITKISNRKSKSNPLVFSYSSCFQNHCSSR